MRAYKINNCIKKRFIFKNIYVCFVIRFDKLKEPRQTRFTDQNERIPYRLDSLATVFAVLPIFYLTIVKYSSVWQQAAISRELCVLYLGALQNRRTT